MSLVLALVLGTALQEPNCRDPQTQLDMNICAGESYGRADRDLNRLWPRVIAAARAQDREIDRNRDNNPTGEAELRRAQRAWITFRDAHCAVESYEARGGSMQPMLYEGCRARLTEERVRQLRTVLGD